MLDPLAQQIGIGGVFALLVIGLIMKSLPAMLAAMRGKGNDKNNSLGASGKLTPADWEGRIGKIVEDKVQAHDSQRNEDIRRIVREEIARFDSGQERIIAEIRNLK